MKSNPFPCLRQTQRAGELSGDRQRRREGLRGERLPVREGDGETEGLFSDFKHTVSVQKITAALSPSEGR